MAVEQKPLGADPNVKPGEPLGKPNPQGNNPKYSDTAEAVVPPGLESKDRGPAEPAAGRDPDSLMRAAKHQAAAADDLVSEEDAAANIERARKAREVISRRNLATSPGEVEKYDAELKSLGFDLPHPVPPAAQRVDEPVGRRSPGRSKA